MIVAVVEAMPLVVKVALYGPLSAGQPVDQLLPDRHRQLGAGQLLAAEAEDVVAVPGGEVHQLVGQLVVVLQGVHQRHRLDARARRAAFRVSRRNSVSPVARAWW